MPPTYPVKDMLLPRSFVYATNSETLVLQSSTAEARIHFVNSYAPLSKFSVSSSNDVFQISKDNSVIATFNHDNGASTVAIPAGGKILSPVFESIPSRKSFVLYDNNRFSQNQFTGFGYSANRIQYQSASASDIHAFQVAVDAFSSAELMRIQSTQTGSPQVGIGTTQIPTNVTLAVSGATQIQGDLTVSGALNFDKTGIVQLEQSTQRIASNIMPQKVLFLNDNNQVDPTYFPQEYKFQFFRAQKNVGIGTRRPLQRLHVNGTSFFTERIGIGTATPLATLHAVEKQAVIPALRLENNVGGNVLEAYANGSNIFTVYGGSATGVGASVGIGTTIVRAGNVLQVRGNGELEGRLVCSNVDVFDALTTDRFTVKNRATNEVILTQQNLVQFDSSTRDTFVCQAPFVFNTSISTPSICGIGSDPYVYVRNTGLRVDGDFILGSQMYALSDARLKRDRLPITDALAKLACIRGYTYVKNNATRREAGVLAQEILEVLPEAVRPIADDTQHLAVAYDALIPLLIEAVRELSAEVAALKASR